MTVKKSTVSKGSEGNKMVMKLLVLLSVLCSSVTPMDPYGAKITIPVTRGKDVVVASDLCSVIDCGGDGNSWRGYDIYMCVFPHRVGVTAGTLCYGQQNQMDGRHHTLIAQ